MAGCQSFPATDAKSVALTSDNDCGSKRAINKHTQHIYIILYLYLHTHTYIYTYTYLTYLNSQMWTDDYLWPFAKPREKPVLMTWHEEGLSCSSSSLQHASFAPFVAGVMIFHVCFMNSCSTYFTYLYLPLPPINVVTMSPNLKLWAFQPGEHETIWNNMKL